MRGKNGFVGNVKPKVAHSFYKGWIDLKVKL